MQLALITLYQKDKLWYIYIGNVKVAQNEKLKNFLKSLLKHLTEKKKIP